MVPFCLALSNLIASFFLAFSRTVLLFTALFIIVNLIENRQESSLSAFWTNQPAAATASAVATVGPGAPYSP